MESEDPRNSANEPAEFTGEATGERDAPIAEDSGYVTTKQAAKALGVSRRHGAGTVRRGPEAVVEGKGVEKTFYASIDSPNAPRARRSRRRKSAAED